MKQDVLVKCCHAVYCGRGKFATIAKHSIFKASSDKASSASIKTSALIFFIYSFTKLKKYETDFSSIGSAFYFKRL